MKYLYFLTLFSTFSLFAQIDGNPDLEVSILSRDVISGMEMSISSDGRIFIAERDGRVRLYDSKTKKISTILELETDLRLESGFMGIALDPNFDKTGWIYLYHTVPPKDEKAEHHYHHLGRFDFRDGKMIPESEKVLLKVRAAFVPERIHEAGSIAFDKNGLLYLSVGDNQIRSEYLFSCKTSANTNDLRGKILRFKPEADGSIAFLKETFSQRVLLRQNQRYT